MAKSESDDALQALAERAAYHKGWEDAMASLETSTASTPDFSTAQQEPEELTEQNSGKFDACGHRVHIDRLGWIGYSAGVCPDCAGGHHPDPEELSAAHRKHETQQEPEGDGKILRLEGEYIGVRHMDMAIPEAMSAVEIFARIHNPLRSEDVQQEPEGEEALYVVVSRDGPDAEFVEIENERGESRSIPWSDHPDGVLHRIGPLYRRARVQPRRVSRKSLTSACLYAAKSMLVDIDEDELATILKHIGIEITPEEEDDG